MRHLFKTKLSELGGLMLVAAIVTTSCSAESQPDDVENAVANSEEYVAPRYVVPEQTAEPAAIPDEAPIVEIDASGWRIKPPFYAAGREPFWRLDVEDGWFVFERLGLPAIEAPIVSPLQEGAGDVFEGDSFTLTLTPGACRSALVGEKTEGAAEVLFEGVLFSGCVYPGASPAADAAPVSGGWIEDVQLYIIEIDACLGALSEQRGLDADTALVTSVYPRGGETTGIVVKDANDQLFECGADSLGDLKFADTLSASAAADWMTGANAFLRTRTEAPPPENCLEAEAVLVDGVPLGYLISEECQ